MHNSKENLTKPIKVHLLNFYGATSHVEICLEYEHTYQSGEKETQYLIMNRWAQPANWFLDKPCQLDDADEKISFDIQAHPNEIFNSWSTYWNCTEQGSSILGNNCAVASQWFLSKYCGIPKPDSSGFNINHMALGICWPSFIPCPILLPGRVMDNAQFHLELKKDKNLAQNNARQVLFYAMSFLSKALISFPLLTLDIVALVLSTTAAIIGLAITGAIMAGKYMLNTIKNNNSNPSISYKVV
jgi:hypothetical protein